VTDPAPALEDDLFAKSLASLRRKLKPKLVGWAPGDPTLGQQLAVKSERPDPYDVPVPTLVHLLGVLINYPTAGRAEKVAWSLYAQIDGEQVILEHRKFGFTICRQPASKVAVSRIVGQLKTAIKLVEAWLEPHARSQIDTGHATIANKFSEFDRRYRYFRGAADDAFAKAAAPPAPPAPGKGLDGLRLAMSSYNAGVRHQHEGFFNSTAMVDAYFSRLEHWLTLLLAFRGRPLPASGLVGFLASKWDAKLTEILPPSTRTRETALGEMRALKARVRNPFAHGGVENDYGSLFFHLNGFGAIPGNFTRFRDSVRFQFIPIEHDDHQDHCSLFDRLDALLGQDDLELPNFLVGEGIDPALDPTSLGHYAMAVSSQAEAADYSRHWNDQWERDTNMDF
jgi:hypothetical protein